MICLVITALIIAGSFLAIAIVSIGAPECDLETHINFAEKFAEASAVVSLKDVGAL